MNFMGTREGAETNVELKYCERCGGLFLRARGAGAVYCVGCTSRLAKDLDSEVATYTRKRHKSRRVRVASGARRVPKLQGSGQIECLQAVAIEEVLSW